MRVLVTGAAGFIGRAATAALLQAGHEVFGVVRSHNPWAGVASPARLNMIAADLARAEQVDLAVEVARPEALLHLAWYADPADCLVAPWENVTSLEHTLGLLRRVGQAGCRRIVLGGSCLEHATGSAVARGPYAASKRAAHAVAATLPRGEVNLACAHIFWVYGPHEDPRRGVPSVVRSVLMGLPVDVTAGRQLREYLHVADVADALRAVLESDLSGRVDIATGRPVPLRDVFETIAAVAGGTGRIRFGVRPSTSEDLFEVKSDPDPLRSLGTWKPRYTLETGLADTVSWWREQLDLDAAPPTVGRSSLRP